MTNPIDPAILERLSATDKIPVLMGPTAGGKTALALRLARMVPSEIVSADSMQFYRGLDIGTAKPTKDELAEIPHHLIDSMDMREPSDVFRFVKEAEAAIDAIRRKGKRPIVVGGSGLYLFALVYGLDPLPANPALRAELDREYDNDEGFPALLDFMRVHCPLDYERFRQCRRRLLRACEVFRISGRQISELQTGPPRQDPRFAQFLLSRPRAELIERIRLRADAMLRAGWIEEAEVLIKQGLLQTPTARQAIGYSIIGEFLAGRLPKSELAERIAVATRQYARRQSSWFRSKHPDAIPISSFE